MLDPVSAIDSDDMELLLPESGAAERSWRLNFDGFQRSEPKEKPPRGLHDCLGVLGLSLSHYLSSLLSSMDLVLF